MATRTITAMFDTRAEAERAVEALASQAGIDRSAVQIGAGAQEREHEGFLSSLKSLFVPDEDRYAYAEGLRRGGCLLTAQVPAGLEDQVYDVLEGSGAVDLDARTSEWQASGWKGYGTEGVAGGTIYSETGVAATGAGAGTAAASGTGARDVTEGEDTVQLMEEQVRVGKREVGRGSVRVRSYVTERPVEEQVELRQERVTVERRPVDRELQPGEAAFQERTIEAVERGEEAVVDKTARVTEEIGIRKDVERETETVRDTVRRTEVEVEDDRAGRDLAGEERVTTTRDRTAG